MSASPRQGQYGDLGHFTSRYGRLKHYCAVCYANTSLSRCFSCKLVYYCSVACQRQNWKEHSEFCKDECIKHSWMEAFERLNELFVCYKENASQDRKSLLASLNILEPWSKAVLISNGLLQLVIEWIQTEKSDKYAFSLVLLVDALRLGDGESIHVDMCFFLLYELNGAEVVLNSIIQRPNLHFNQKVSILRFFRLLAAQPKLQPLLLEKLPELLPLINLICENGESSQLVSEFGIFLSSLLYSSETVFIHHEMQRKCLDELNIQLCMECAFGESKWSADMEMGAMELILALLISADLFPDYLELSLQNNIDEFFLKYPLLLKNLVFGLLDMLIIPKDVFYGSAIHALSLLFSRPLIVDEMMKNLWLLAEIDDEAEATERQLAPLPEMLQIFQKDPIVHLHFFRTHTHINVLQILIQLLSNRYCNRLFLDAAVGNQLFSEHIDYVEKRYVAGLKRANSYKETHSLSIHSKVGNEEEMQDVLKLISKIRNLANDLPDAVDIYPTFDIHI